MSIKDTYKTFYDAIAKVYIHFNNSVYHCLLRKNTNMYPPENPIVEIKRVELEVFN